MYAISVPAQIVLQHNCGNEKTWVWQTPSDFADEEPKEELLAIRFASVECKSW